MTLDPKMLTVEERAWADAVAVALCSSGNYTAEGAIDEAVRLGIPRRRALFPETLCENCGQRGNHLRGFYYGEARFACEPPPPAPTPPPTDEEKAACPQCAAGESHRCDRYATKPAPVASELPLAVQVALEALRYQRKSGVADGLEECVRALLAASATKAQLPKVRRTLQTLASWDFGPTTLQRISESLSELDAAQSKAAPEPVGMTPVPVGMTPDLEDALDWLEMLCAGREADGPAWHKTVADARRSAAAVRAQAASAQAVPVEAIRYALSYLRSDTTKTNLLANIDTADPGRGGSGERTV